MNFRNLAITTSAATILACTANAAELPKTLAVTAYDVGSSGYSQAVAIGSAFKNNYGVTLRVLPGKNDVSRTIPVRDGKVDFSFNGIGTYLSQEGVDVFGTPDWGPQKVRLMSTPMGDNCLNLFWAADIGVNHIKDLKGKRIAWVKGSPALQSIILAALQYGDVSADDIVKVEVGGNSAAFEAVMADQADVFFSTTNSGAVIKMQNSPRGMKFAEMPADDAEGWKRVQSIAPWLRPHECKESAVSLPPWPGSSAPYPLIMMYDKGSADVAYSVTKAIFEQFPNFKDAAPASAGYELARQNLSWIVPFHEGAIRFYKEKDMWTDQDQKNQDALLKRQDTLAKIWSDYTAKPKDNFYEGWMEARHAGLTAAGLDPVWRNF